MASCPSCANEVPGGHRFCPICHENVIQPGSGRLASPGKRFGATLLDVAIPFIVFVGFGVVGAGFGDFGIVLGGLLLLGYLGYALFLFANGTTPGKKALGLTVVSETGQPAGFFRMLMREWVGKWISGAVFSLGYIWILLDDANQGWHDKLVSTYVVEGQMSGTTKMRAAQ